MAGKSSDTHLRSLQIHALQYILHLWLVTRICVLRTGCPLVFLAAELGLEGQEPVPIAAASFGSTAAPSGQAQQ